jgi:hypothetical protein
VNYLEIEARNRRLGLAGEEFAMRFEEERLWRAGQKRLADKIEHVARTRGDGEGYDILSFEESGHERLIEVNDHDVRAAHAVVRYAQRGRCLRRTTGRVLHLSVVRFPRRSKAVLVPGEIAMSFDLEATHFFARLA